MKEVLHTNKDEVVIVKQVSVKKKNELIGQLLPHNGHTLYEFDKKTLKLTKARFNVIGVNFSKKIAENKRVDVREGCFYISSLNASNAIRKIMKIFKVPYVLEIRDVE